MKFSPWAVVGQTKPKYQGAIDNPAVNAIPGMLGAVTAFPYIVPEGKTLVIEQYGLEAYAGVANGLVFVPWIGDGPPGNADCLMSVFSDNATNQLTNLNFHFAAGTKINIRIMSLEAIEQVVGWGMSGYLY